MQGQWQLVNLHLPASLECSSFAAENLGDGGRRTIQSQIGHPKGIFVYPCNFWRDVIMLDI